MPIVNNEYVLRYKDGRYHALGTTSGWSTLERVENIRSARRFASKDDAIRWKNSESHVRHVTMFIVEFATGDMLEKVPLLDPCWEAFDRDYDEYNRLEAEKFDR